MIFHFATWMMHIINDKRYYMCVRQNGKFSAKMLNKYCTMNMFIYTSRITNSYDPFKHLIFNNNLTTFIEPSFTLRFVYVKCSKWCLFPCHSLAEQEEEMMIRFSEAFSFTTAEQACSKYTHKSAVSSTFSSRFSCSLPC